jgi:hypothetical protein
MAFQKRLEKADWEVTYDASDGAFLTGPHDREAAVWPTGRVIEVVTAGSGEAFDAYLELSNTPWPRAG